MYLIKCGNTRVVTKNLVLQYENNTITIITDLGYFYFIITNHMNEIDDADSIKDYIYHDLVATIEDNFGYSTTIIDLQDYFVFVAKDDTHGKTK